MDFFTFVADILSILGGITALIIAAFQIKDRLQYVKFKISIVDSPGNKSDVCLLAILINKSVLPLFPRNISLLVDGNKIEPFPYGFLHSKTNKMFAPVQPKSIERNRSINISFNLVEVFELVDKLVINKHKFKVQAILQIESGKQFKSNVITISRNDFESFQ